VRVFPLGIVPAVMAAADFVLLRVTFASVSKATCLFDAVAVPWQLMQLPSIKVLPVVAYVSVLVQAAVVVSVFFSSPQLVKKNVTAVRAAIEIFVMKESSVGIDLDDSSAILTKESLPQKNPPNK
jgi:hypothetical protein